MREKNFISIISLLIISVSIGFAIGGYMILLEPKIKEVTSVIQGLQTNISNLEETIQGFQIQILNLEEAISSLQNMSQIEELTEVIQTLQLQILDLEEAVLTLNESEPLPSFQVEVTGRFTEYYCINVTNKGEAVAHDVKIDLYRERPGWTSEEDHWVQILHRQIFADYLIPGDSEKMCYSKSVGPTGYGLIKVIVICSDGIKQIFITNYID